MVWSILSSLAYDWIAVVNEMRAVQALLGRHRSYQGVECLVSVKAKSMFLQSSCRAYGRRKILRLHRSRGRMLCELDDACSIIT